MLGVNRNFIAELWETIASKAIRRNAYETSAVTCAKLIAMSWDILSRRGEASGNKLAYEFLEAYRVTDVETRLAFLHALVHEFAPDKTRLQSAIAAYLAQETHETLRELGNAAEPRRQELMRRLNQAQGGTAALVRMREDVLRAIKTNPEFRAIDHDFAHLFTSWFNRGFLVLRRIDWTTPANILAKIIQYEAVHAIQSWDDLRNRLEPADRRCFAFFHPQMADEPLVFVEVALTREIPDAVQPLLALKRAEISADTATTAVFYSISNCQTGLKGVSFGNFLIKQVVEDLKRDLPNLKTFVTLSPVPGLRAWLKTDDPAFDAMLEGELSEAQSQKLRDAATRYFLTAKNNEYRPLDPVARFHLGNGAQLARLNMRGDYSPNGLRQSAGVMVNYVYDLAAIETNHEAYANEGKLSVSKTFSANAAVK